MMRCDALELHELIIFFSPLWCIMELLENSEVISGGYEICSCDCEDTDIQIYVTALLFTWPASLLGRTRKDDVTVILNCCFELLF